MSKHEEAQQATTTVAVHILASNQKRASDAPSTTRDYHHHHNQPQQQQHKRPSQEHEKATGTSKKTTAYQLRYCTTSHAALYSMALSSISLLLLELYFDYYANKRSTSSAEGAILTPVTTACLLFPVLLLVLLANFESFTFENLTRRICKSSKCDTNSNNNHNNSQISNAAELRRRQQIFFNGGGGGGDTSSSSRKNSSAAVAATANSSNDELERRLRCEQRARYYGWTLLVCSTAWSLLMALLQNQLMTLQLTTTFALYLLASFRVRRWTLALALASNHALHLALYPFGLFSSDDRRPRLQLAHPNDTTTIGGGGGGSGSIDNVTTTTTSSNHLLREAEAEAEDNGGTILSSVPMQMLLIALAYGVFHLVGFYLHERRERQRVKSIEDIERFVKSRVDLCTEDKKLTKMLESVIPRHLASKMREDILDPNAAPAGNFHKSYLDSFRNVSILFADIVNFTKISSNCSAQLLVETLNELFGRFDKAADKNNCLRIKILGDCYYCVSGIPERVGTQEPHARQCVEMGLDMIDILDDLARDNNQVDLKMRVGIHTGRVLCGILGKKKWQFDVHSNDVKLANHLEQSGIPGRVHITEDTLRQLRASEAAAAETTATTTTMTTTTTTATAAQHVVYRVEPGNGHLRDTYIASRGIATFFVITPDERRRSSYSSFCHLSSMAASRLLSGSVQQQQQQQQQLQRIQEQRPVELAAEAETRPPLLVANGAAPAAAAATTTQQVVARASIVDASGTTRLAAHDSQPQTVTLARLKRFLVASSGGGGGGNSSRRVVSSAIDLEAMAAAASDEASNSQGRGGSSSSSSSSGRNHQVIEHQTEGAQVRGCHSGETVALLSPARGEDPCDRKSISGSQQSTATGGGGDKQLAATNKKTTTTHLSVASIASAAAAAAADASPGVSRSASDSACVGASQMAPAAPPPPQIVGLARFKQTTQRIINVLHFIRTIEAPFANLDLGTPPAAGLNIDKMICDRIEERKQISDVHRWTLRFKDDELARRYRSDQFEETGSQQGPRRRRKKFAARKFANFKQICIFACALLALLALAYASLFRKEFYVSQPTTTTTTTTTENLNDKLDDPVGGHFAKSLALLAQFVIVFLEITLVYWHQSELDSRRDFIWRQKALADKSQMARMRDCNKFIFFNLLPPHVATYFLERTHLRHMDLYYHSCDLIGVIFATVSNFSDFYSEIQGNDHGKGCLQVLNEILCEFDLLLDWPAFAPIDKIKTIGSTYMAAIGLCPNYELPSLASASERDSPQRRALIGYLKTMLEFINEMRQCLHEINVHSYNNFKLRVGFNIGPVTAGVIGATKPQYDIWGNTVNVASRMESTCEPDHLQITEDIYALLSTEPDLTFTCRGEIDVKGKGIMTTYYVNLKQPVTSSF